MICCAVLAVVLSQIYVALDVLKGWLPGRAPDRVPVTSGAASWRPARSLHDQSSQAQSLQARPGPLARSLARRHRIAIAMAVALAGVTVIATQVMTPGASTTAALLICGQGLR